MKKFTVILNLFLILSLTACTTSSLNKLEFANPIFNQPLRPLSSQTGYAYLTPTSVDFRSPRNKDRVVSTGKCELVENEQDHITLLCDVYIVPFDERVKRYYTYTIKRVFFSGCLLIEKTLRNYGSTKTSATGNYCVTPPPNYSPSESD